MPNVNLRQLSLFSPDSQRPFNAPFPSTRYQGSKRQLAEWIWENVAYLPFESVLDVFGGFWERQHQRQPQTRTVKR